MRYVSIYLGSFCIKDIVVKFSTIDNTTKKCTQVAGMYLFELNYVRGSKIANKNNKILIVEEKFVF